MSNSNVIILGENTDSYSRWDASLRARLAKRDLTGHVIHDDEDVDPVNKPAAPLRAADTTDSERALIWKEHRLEVLTWKNNETEARNIILERLSTKVWPRDYVRLSAKNLYDSVTKTRKESASKPYLEALRQFYNVRLISTADHYCDAFLTAYQNVNTAAETLSSGDENPVDRSISEATAAVFFIVGTMHLPGLSTWRDHKAIDSTDRPVSLHSMMSSLRNTTISEYSGRQSTPAHAAPTRPVDPNAPCRKCAHKHLNKECYKQNPDLARQRYGDKWRYGKAQKEDKGKGKAAAEVGEMDESEDEMSFKSYLDSIYDKNTGRKRDSGIAATSSSSHNKTTTIYDTGASHRFFPVKSVFENLTKRHKPFQFDQAVGVSSLTEQDKPIARLALINDVYYIHPLQSNDTNTSKVVAAPGVARIPSTTSTQRWHQRLGHIGQQILKRTKDHTIGLEGIDTTELSTCETCHLSKAQRYVSREPRPTPHEPLDEIFVDTVGKLVQSLDKMQYATIITDARTRMRWVLTTATKDQIAPTLVKWIQSMHHQYDKRVKAIFKDGGSEFFRIKTFCEQHGIRTDTSAPYTPE
ncbi:hypothetical protein K3495_g8495 [Podosphaera aphanis]|nr:hypothetical protein K3495_g8495 [Podosphaera aphanis]